MELMRTRRRFTLIALGSQEEVENKTSIFFSNKIVFKANSECTSFQSQQANGAVETETLLEHTGEDKDANQDDSNLVNVNANMEKKARNVRHEDREEILRNFVSNYGYISTSFKHVYITTCDKTEK